MSNYLNATEARKITEAALELPVYMDAAFSSIRDAAENGEYEVQIDFSFAPESYSTMSDEEKLMRGKIIQRLKNAKFVVNCTHDETDSPSVIVSWKEVVDCDCN